MPIGHPIRIATTTSAVLIVHAMSAQTFARAFAAATVWSTTMTGTTITTTILVSPLSPAAREPMLSSAPLFFSVIYFFRDRIRVIVFGNSTNASCARLNDRPFKRAAMAISGTSDTPTPAATMPSRLLI